MKASLASLLILTLAACSQTPQPGAGAASGNSASSATTRAPSATMAAPANDTTMLTKYHWRLASATDTSGRRIDALFARADKLLQLDFDASGLSVSNTCNRMHGSYSLTNGKLAIGQIASTLMACHDPKLTALDRAIGNYLQGSLGFTLDHSGTEPRLTLATTAGDTLEFTGVPTAETRFGSNGETEFLEVAPETRPCNESGAPDAQCLYVRDLHYNANGTRDGQPGPWHVLGPNIDGYTHQPGSRNVLRVKRYNVANPPAGASSVAYVLDMVVESQLPPR